jgi:hypothetical protein
VTAALVVGVVLALACLAYVLYPLVRRERGRPARRVVTDEEIEAAVRAYRDSLGARACPVCGPRTESDALFCSTCGRRIADDTAP